MMALGLIGSDQPQPKTQTAMTYRPRVSLDDFAYNLEQLIEAAREHGVHVLLVAEPCGPNSDVQRTGKAGQPWAINVLKNYEALVDLHAEYNQRTREVAQRLHVPLVDADREFSRRDKTRLFDPWDMMHPNEAGHRLIAEMLLQRMIDEGWITAQ